LGKAHRRAISNPAAARSNIFIKGDKESMFSAAGGFENNIKAAENERRESSGRLI